MPFDGVAHRGGALVYPVASHPKHYSVATALSRALKTGYVFSRKKTVISHHPYFIHDNLDFYTAVANGYNITGTSYQDILRIEVTVPLHATHVSIHGSGWLRSPVEYTFTHQIVCDDGSSTDSGDEVATSGEGDAWGGGGEPQGLGAADLVLRDGALREAFWGQPSKFVFEASVALSNITAPDTIDVYLQGRFAAAGPFFTPSFITVFWEVQG